MGRGAQRATGGSESGQAIALGVLWMALGALLLLAVPGLALGYAERAEAQSAADAAALACASRATVTTYVDARGEVYGKTATVDAVAGPAAGAVAWGDNLAFWPLRTLAFTATPSGADCTVRVEVRSTLPVLHMLHLGSRGFAFETAAEARAYITPH